MTTGPIEAHGWRRCGCWCDPCCKGDHEACTALVPRPPEGPDREALASVIGHALKASILFDRGNDAHRLDIAGIVADAVLALLPTPPAPGDDDVDSDLGRQSRDEGDGDPLPGPIYWPHSVGADVPTDLGGPTRGASDYLTPAPGDGGTDLRGEIDLYHAVEAVVIDARAPDAADLAERVTDAVCAALAARDTDQGARALAEAERLIDLLRASRAREQLRAIKAESERDTEVARVRELLDAERVITADERARADTAEAALARATPEAGEGKP